MSQLAVEKVIVELNSFRKQIAMIREEITKTTSSLNDRASILNDAINKSLNQLGKQLGEGQLSELLSLQSRYQSGQISDQDYQARRDYYGTEIRSMIQTLDETKKVMMIMAQLDQRTASTASDLSPQA